MKVAVLGTGVMGLTAALEVIKQGGHDLTVYTDPGKKSASRCAGGMLAPYSESDSLDTDLQALAVRHSLPYWQDLAKDMGGHYANHGTLVVAHDADAGYLKRFETHLPQGTYEQLDQQGLDAKEPLLGRRFNGGLWVYDEAYLDTAQMLKSMLEFVASHADIVQKPYDSKEYDLIIDARGSYAPDKNLRMIKGERILVKCDDINLSHCVRMMHPRYPLYIVPHANNYFMIGASMIEDNKSEEFSVRTTLELLSAFTSLGGQVLESDIVAMDTGFRPAYINHRPKITKKDNIISCNGLYRHGFLLAPILARAIFDESDEFNVVKEAPLEAVH